MATELWVSSDNEIWNYDFSDQFIWLPSLATDYQFISAFDVCSPELGKINSGELEFTYTDDNNKFILNEMNTTPGFCYLFEHYNMPNAALPYVLHFRGTYGGSEDHTVKFQLYDWDATAYVDISTLATSLLTQDYYYNLPTGSQYFSNEGGEINVIRIRVIHEEFGNSGHLLRINYWNVDVGSV